MYDFMRKDRMLVGKRSICSENRELLRVKSYDGHSRFNVISDLEMHILECKNCPGLNMPENTPSTPAYGDYDARLLVVGQSLHSYDMPANTRQIPFIWLNSPNSYGAEMFWMLNRLGYTFNDGLLVTNIVKCHPPGNRRSLPSEVKNCKPYLNLELDIVKPKIILLLGSDAARAFEVPFKLFYYTNIYFHKYIVAYHPSYINRFLPKLFPTYFKEIQNRIESLEALK